MQSSETPRQLNLELNLSNPFSLDYFVVHSGVSEAYLQLEAMFKLVAEGKGPALVFLQGPRGVGKTHLSEGFKSKAGPEEFVQTFCFLEDETAGQVADFVSSYEANRTRKGLLIVESREAVAELRINPHIHSRLLSGTPIELRYATEDETLPLFRSILERKNLRLSETTLRYLLPRVPLNPALSEEFFDKIQDFCYSNGLSAGRNNVRAILAQLEASK